MAQQRCKVCINEPRSVSQHCGECKGTTWVDIPTNCQHPNEEYEAMMGGWYCPDCKESGPL